jgi:hypothetical protein
MESKNSSILAHMNWLDWLLALVFIGLLAWIGGLFLPVYGWPLGAIAALALLYLAKSRRDRAIQESQDPARLKEDE